jgi:hypothetical protein
MPLNNINIDIKYYDKIYLEKPKKINKNQIEPKIINKIE